MHEQKALLQKVYAAEKNVAGVRLAVILLNIFVYLFFMDHAGTRPALAYAIIIVATAYAAYVLALEPYKQFPVLLSSYFTSASDASLILLWVYATGGFDSPFYVLWYVSIVAIAFRYSPRATLWVATAYAALYGLLLVVEGAWTGNVGAVAVRIGYILLIGALGALLSREATNQTAARARIQERMQEVERSEARFRTLIEAAPDAMIILDADQRILLVNGRTETFFGHKRGDLAGKPVDFLISSGGLLRTGVPLPADGEAPATLTLGTAGDVAARHADGREFPIEVRLSAIPTPEGHAYCAFVRDLSDRRLREDELRTVHATVLAVSQTASFDEALQVAVHRICSAAGWSLGEAWAPQEKGGRLVLRHAWSPHGDRFLAFVEAGRNLFLRPGLGLPGKGWATQRPVWVPDMGKALDMPRHAVARTVGLGSGFAMPVVAGSGPVAVLVFFHQEARQEDEDFVRLTHTVATQLSAILERHKAEDALRRLSTQQQLVLESAGEGIFGLDPEGGATFLNPTTTKLLGWTGDELQGTLAHDRIHPVRPDGTACDWSTCRLRAPMADRKPHRVANDVFRHRDGSAVHVEYVSAPLVDATAGTLGIVVVFDDVGERIQAEREAAKVRDRLDEIQRLKQQDTFKTQFINTAAHELNTPLTPIKLQLHVLGKTMAANTNPVQRNALVLLERNVDRLAALVQDILAGARLQAGRFTVARVPVDLSRIVKDAVQSYEEPARTAGVTIKTHTQPAVHVVGDANRLTQIFYNLLSNALKFTPEGGTIHVRTIREGEQAIVKVRDTGTGMTQEQIANLFLPFSQVHDPKPSDRGTGLGLYISKGIAELHHGSLRCDSPGPGKGSTFTLALPLSSGTAPPEAPDAPPEPEPEVSRAFDRRVRELI